MFQLAIVLLLLLLLGLGLLGRVLPLARRLPTISPLGQLAGLVAAGSGLLGVVAFTNAGVPTPPASPPLVSSNGFF